MRKIYSLLAMMVLALGIPAVAQESIQNYVEGFDNLDTSNHEFAPKGWGHIVDSYSSGWSSSYVEYSNPQTGGQDGGAYLSIGSQEVNAGWTTASLNDILVTPAVSGNVSIYVKLEKASGSIKFFTCTKNGNEFTASEEEYAVEIPELSEEAWTQVSIPDVPAGTYLGIRGEDVGIDNFAAENATIVYKRELTIESAELVTETIAGGGIDAGEDGNASFTYCVTLTNTGEVDLNPGDEGYSISIVHSDAPETPLSTKELDFPLAVGATSQPVDISVTIPVEEEIYDHWDVKENISGTTEYVTWLTLYPYKSDFFVSEGDHADIFEPGTELQFGLSQQPVTKTFRLRNNGGAEATVTAVTAPEGFTYKVRNAENVEQQLPLVVPAHSGTDFYLDVTMTADAPGAKSGDLVIKVEGYEDLEFPLSGQIVDPSKFYVNFEDQQFPAGTYLEGDSWRISNFPKQQSIEGNSYCAENTTSSYMEKLVFPKVHVAAGETMVFSAAKRSLDSKINVYYSSDRLEWTLVRTIHREQESEADHFSDETTGVSSYDNYVFKQFTIDNIPEGDWYIAFEAGYARLDDIMGYTLLDVPEVDFVVTDLNIPGAGTVNYEYSASIGLYNVGSVAVEENKLMAKLYVGDNVVDEKSLPAMEIGASASVDFAYTPREAGSFTAKIVVENNGVAVVEQSAQLEISGEKPSADYSLGTAEGYTSSNVPLSLNYNNSDSETIYTKDLIGFPAGAKILQLVYRGYKTTDTHKAHVKVWIENTTDGIFTSKPEDLHPTSGMTQIYDGEYTFEKKGSSQDIQDMLVIPLAEPFEYTGENLRVIVRAEKIDQYKSVAFECDRNVKDASAYRRNDSAVPTGSLTLSSELPVVHMLVEKELTTLSGKVVSSKDQSAIAGAAIKLVSGNVEYSGVSGEDGSYNIGIYQDTKEYVLSVEKEGYFKYEKTVTFPEGSTEMDIAMDVATGFRIKEASVPASGMVNYAYTATVTIENGLEKPAGSYTAELYVNGEVVDTDNEADLEANSDHTFTFGFTPHTAGTFPAYVKLTSEYGTTQTEEVQLVIAEESAESLVQVGEVEEITTDGGPIHSYNSTTRTEIIYPKEMIGLEAGSKIISLEYRGYHYGKDGVIYNTQVWIGNVSDTEFKENDVTGMTKIFDGQIDYTKDRGSDEEAVPLIDIAIPDGFAYTGENIRVVVAANDPDGGWVSGYFEADNSVMGYARQKAADSSSLEELDNDIWYSWEDIALPVVYFGVVPSKNVSGVVTDAETDAPIEGAEITLKSGEVEYYGTSDAEGAYSIDVIQYSLAYEMEVVAEGYEPATQAVSFDDGDVVANVELTALPEEYTYSGTVVDGETNEPVAGAVVTVSAEGGEPQTMPTGDDGGFSFTLLDGEYTVTVACEGYLEYSSELTIAGADVTGAQIALTPEVKEYTYSGTVIDGSTSAPVANAIVTVSAEGGEPQTATTGADGGFSFTLLDGEYAVTVACEGYEDGHFNVTIDGADVVGVELVITERSGISMIGVDGTVYGGDGCIFVVTESEASIYVYNTAGVLVRRAEVEAGTTRIDGIGAGVYVVNGVKVMVK